MKNTPSLCKKNSPLSILPWTLAGLAFLLAVTTPALGTTQTAVVATVAADYSSSAVSIIPVDAENGARTAQNDLLPQTTSDISVSSYDNYYYLISKYGTNTVAKVDIAAPETVIWQYSTEGDETNSNPYEMVSVSSEKAYLIRYGSSTAWIVNPSAESEEDFKIGELDLSAYDEGDGVPEMAGAVIVGGKLFIMMQRLFCYSPSDAKPYIAVFDTETDTEIDTAQGEGDLKGIPLDIKDPLAIQYLEENDTIYVQGIGYYAVYGYGTGYEYDGGIVAIDPAAYSVDLILDDGDSTNHPYGNISGMVIVSPTKGYFVGCKDSYLDSVSYTLDNTLYAFDPSADNPTGTVVAGFENKSIAGMESGAYADQNGMLWVCNQTDAQVDILDTDTDTIEESVSTNLNPAKVVFTTEEDADDGDGSVGTDDDSGTCFISNVSKNGAMPPSSGALLALVILLAGLLTLRYSRK